MAEEVTIQPAGDHAKLAAKLGEGAVGIGVLADGQQITDVAPDAIFQAATVAKKLGYPLLSCLSAYDGKTELGVFYSFIKLAQTPAEFGELCMRVRLPRPDGAGKEWIPEVQSLCDLMPAANWQEREMYDLFGIRFDGHPDMRRIFLPEDWIGFPGRKDYSEAEQFVAMRDGEDITLQTQEEGSW